MEVEDVYRPPQADMEIPAPQQLAEAQRARAPFFQTSVLKVVLLSVATFGFYHLTWFYRQWARREEEGEDLSPIGRTLFVLLFAYGLFKSVNEEIDLRADLEVAQRSPEDSPQMPGPRIAHLPAAVLALLYGAFSISIRIPNGPRFPVLLGLLVASLSCVPLVIVQRTINALHAKLGFDPKEGSTFTPSSIAALVIGSLFWLLIVLGQLATKR
jgi:hypothetical protein